MQVHGNNNVLSQSKVSQLTQTLNADDWSDGEFSDNVPTPIITNEDGNNNKVMSKKGDQEKVEGDVTTGKIMKF